MHGAHPEPVAERIRKQGALRHGLGVGAAHPVFAADMHGAHPEAVAERIRKQGARGDAHPHPLPIEGEGDGDRLIGIQSRHAWASAMMRGARARSTASR